MASSQSVALSEVDRVSLPSRSMFAATPVWKLEDADATIVFGLRQPITLPATGDVSVTVPQPAENRLDLIAAQFYGQSNAWWAIADASGLIDPLAGVTQGTTLRVPSAGRLPV